MRSTRTWIAAVGAAATLTLATSCSTGDVDDDPAPVDQGTNPSASPSPTDEPVATTEPEGVDFTTQNGTSSLTLPADWVVQDTSGPAIDYEGRDIWSNALLIVDADGVERIRYYDGMADATGTGTAEVRIVDAIPTPDRLTAVAWWVSAGTSDGSTPFWMANVALVDDPGMPLSIVTMSGRSANVDGVLTGIPECAVVDSEETATACLESDMVAETLEVLATFERHDVPWDAMP
ncbi:hypothetical protein [Agrococcus jejuensis]|uniref:Lipoprotein n=1 Tax=Agrococcus jejuensis TaxID=399736 RepID=A0A1G8C106_9MICO|nr:hypothetical protein [Agrococcus jejuensis]SDH39054.1 hypothetical protein SAMN04489720_1124 [Agrococcus jejuensis]